MEATPKVAFAKPQGWSIAFLRERSRKMVHRAADVNGTDVRRARHVASQLLAGRVAINGMLDDQQAPFGGFKNSGVGREFGTYGIEAFLEPRAILEA
jgi:acyl-CoA reductase-like NAD-dependent aldehyde dehydrogenase